MTPTLNFKSLLGGELKIYNWTWQNQAYGITYEIRGAGLPLLLLPAFSTVSSRAEMQGFAEYFSPNFQVFALDWLGFGQSERPALDYTPALYQQLLQDFVTATFSQPVCVIAAGHAAGYVMHLAKQQPQLWAKIVLIAPTWRGPLPTMGAPRALATAVQQLVRLPLLGQFLYKLNTQPSFLSWMYRRHVFTDAAHLTPDFIAQKWQSTQAPGARFGPAAFVTGGLDPMLQRADYLACFHGLATPVMVLIGEQTPPKSRTEMEVLADFSDISNVRVQRYPGSLGMHEEYATTLIEAISPFLNQ
jgi:pimeloyl-ACP methyl ester carboxylesterase